MWVTRSSLQVVCKYAEFVACMGEIKSFLYTLQSHVGRMKGKVLLQLILNSELEVRGLHVPTALPLRNNHQYTLNERLGGLQSQSGSYPAGYKIIVSLLFSSQPSHCSDMPFRFPEETTNAYKIMDTIPKRRDHVVVICTDGD